MGVFDFAVFGGKARLRTKMLLLTAVLLTGFLFIALMSFQTIKRSGIGSAGYRQIAEARTALEGSLTLKADIFRLHAEELDLAEETDGDKVRKGIATIKSLASGIPAQFAAILNSTGLKQGKEPLSQAEKNWRDVSSVSREEIIPALQRGDRARVRELVSGIHGAKYDRIAADLDTAIGTLRSQIGEIEATETGSVRKTVLMGLLVGGGILLIIVLVAWSVAGSIARAVAKEAVFARSVVAEGNLSDRLSIERGDEIGDLAESLNTLVDLLYEMVTKVNTSSLELSRISRTLADASKQVYGGAEQTNTRVGETSSAIMEINASIKEVSHGIDSLSLSASENSSSVLEMAASVEEVALNVENLAQSVDDVSSSIIEMAAAVKHISDSVNGLIDSSTVTASSVIQMDSAIRQVEKNALDTAAISEEVRRDAETGKVSVEATISGMQEIKRSSHITYEVIVSLSEKANDIGTILSVINEVAEQTNLLALNAAIIAAQAGEQGKGFAVVADEIKELADRTSSSTREIEELIKGVQEETHRAVDAINLAEKSIADGELLSQKSGIALGKIVSGVEKASEQVGEIAHAAAEQAKGSQMIREAMEQVTDMIMQIANATQQQSKGSELIMTAVERMKVLTSQVRSSTREQSKVGTLIAGSTENITSMIRQIKRACDEQSRGSEQIVSAVEDIQKSTHENLGTAGTMEKAVGGLSRQVEVLQKETSGFRLQ
ncbi:MAG: HAMP domain-containing protein [Deltaproteobacteria bacterium]|nr:HAMP domain-containing protein [Deltaproteobacteria bacterium]